MSSLVKILKMSKIGKTPITIPEQVMVKIEGSLVTASGPKGELTFKIPAQIKVVKEKDRLIVTRVSDEGKAKALHGTVRQRLANMLRGVWQGFSKTLEIVGTGYRASFEKDRLVLSLGFSHSIEFLCPEGVKFEVEGGKIKVEGADKVLVGQTAANIRKIRPPDAYKGKGIRYEGEEIKLKPGKAAKVGAGAPVGGEG